MRRTAIRHTGLATAACCCVAVGTWGASATAAAALPPRAAPTASVASGASVASAPRCYAARGDPDRVVCYRTSYKAEFRNGDIVYVPRLIQVPTPSPPPSAVIVDSLNDIRPDGGPGSGSGPGHSG